jgi:hypothetical protein
LEVSDLGRGAVVGDSRRFLWKVEVPAKKNILYIYNSSVFFNFRGVCGLS